MYGVKVILEDGTHQAVTKGMVHREILDSPILKESESLLPAGSADIHKAVAIQGLFEHKMNRGESIDKNGYLESSAIASVEIYQFA